MLSGNEKLSSVFSAVTMEFSVDIQLSVTKKSEITKRTFSAVTMDFRTFSLLSVEFSTVKMGTFGDFKVILFYSYDGNRIFATKPVYLTYILITSLVIDYMLLLSPPILILLKDMDLKVKVLGHLL
jgi:hypothetical protein